MDKREAESLSSDIICAIQNSYSVSIVQGFDGEYRVKIKKLNCPIEQLAIENNVEVIPGGYEVSIKCKEKKLRPYKMGETYKLNGRRIRNKKTKTPATVIGLSFDRTQVICAGRTINFPLTFQRLLKDYEHMDGSPCGFYD